MIDLKLLDLEKGQTSIKKIINTKMWTLVKWHANDEKFYNSSVDG